MAAAVVVTSPVGPPTPECPIYLQANEAIVTWTQQFIDWQAAPADAAGLIGGDGLLGSGGVGQADSLKPAESLMHLPRPSAPASRATSINLLAAPLRTLAHAIKPQRIVIDQGGAGQCGPNTLSFLLGMLPVATLDAAAKDRLGALAVMDARANWFLARRQRQPR